MARSTGNACTSSIAAESWRAACFGISVRFGVAAPDGPLPQRFDLRKKLVAGLLAQHHAEQRAKGAHVAAQRSLLQLAALRLKLGQSLGPALGIPQKSHRISIMHDGIQRSGSLPLQLRRQLLPLGIQRCQLRAKLLG